jgi:hypothetical protein
MHTRSSLVFALVVLALAGCGPDLGPRQPDLAFAWGPNVTTSTSSTPSYVLQGQPFTVSFGITNQGELVAPGLWRITRNGVTVASGTTENINNQGQISVAQNIVENTPGVYTYQIQLDPDNTIDESENNDWGGQQHQAGEYNNNASFTFTIMGLGSA